MTMVGFILSKMNLLVLVTAIFVIVTYFSFGFSEVMLAQKAVYLINEYATPIQNMVNSPNLCVTTTYQLPAVIKYFGGKEFFYKIKINKIISTDEVSPNYIVFALSGRGKKSTVIAAKKIETSAEIHLFSTLDPETGETTTSLFDYTDTDEIVLDPQSKSSVDSIYLAKQINDGKGYVFLMTCSAAQNTCKINEPKIGDAIKSMEGFSDESICVKGSS